MLRAALAAVVVLLTIPVLPVATATAGVPDGCVAEAAAPTCPPTIAGPASAPRGAIMILTGHATAEQPVEIWVRGQGAGQFQHTDSVRSGADGSFASRYRATVDVEYYATENGVMSTTSLTRAVGTTLAGPRLVRRGSTATLRGLAHPGHRVDVLFRGRGQAAFADRRDVWPTADGRWSTTFTADRDYRIYAHSSEAASPQIVTRVSFASIFGPPSAPSRVRVTLRGTARPGSSVAIWMRRAGTSGFSPRRTTTATKTGTYAASYVADASYAYYAVSDSVRSSVRSTTVQPARLPGTKGLTALDVSGIRTGYNASRLVRLSFDDCAEPAVFDRLVRLLHRENVQAVFFFTGKCFAMHPTYRARLEAENQLLGNHSFDHTDYRRLTDAQIRSQLVSGVRPTTTPALARPPYGDLAFSTRFYNIAAAVGMRPAFWTVDSRDWAHLPAARITQRILRGEPGSSGTPPVKPGGFVLLHGTADHTLEALPGVITGLRTRHLALFALR